MCRLLLWTFIITSIPETGWHKANLKFFDRCNCFDIAGWCHVVLILQNNVGIAGWFCVVLVLQDDVVMGTLTVRENFLFSASLRLPSSLSSKERNEKVDTVIQELGLTHCADTKVNLTCAMYFKEINLIRAHCWHVVNMPPMSSGVQSMQKTPWGNISTVWFWFTE